MTIRISIWQKGANRPSAWSNVGGVWIPVTLLASSAQTLRNAMQRDLIGALGAGGAAQVRFLFGLPFAVMFLAGVLAEQAFIFRG